jgi:hypothetical protein
MDKIDIFIFRIMAIAMGMAYYLFGFALASQSLIIEKIIGSLFVIIGTVLIIGGSRVIKDFK